MTDFRPYPKIHALGYSGTDEVFEAGGTLTIQPKIDGSNVGIWIMDEKTIKFSKRSSFISCAEIEGRYTAQDKMFRPFVDWVTNHVPNWDGDYDIVLFGEMAMNQQKLKYAETRPFILFDIAEFSINEDGQTEFHFIPQNKVREYAEARNLPYVEPIYEGPAEAWDFLKIEEILIRDSILGGCKEEGLVLKRYDRLSRYGGPLWTKVVTTAFREANGGKKPRNNTASGIGDWIADSFFNRPRLEKAIQKLKEEGKWAEDNTKKNIGPLIGVICKDIYEEHWAEIEEEAAKAAWKNGSRLISARVAPELDALMTEGL